MLLALKWYVFIGIVWFYLLMHEYHQKGELACDWSDSKIGTVVRIVSLFVIGVVLWPLSLYRHLRHGDIRRLFE